MTGWWAPAATTPSTTGTATTCSRAAAATTPTRADRAPTSFVFAPSESCDKIITDFQDVDRIVLSNAASGLWPSVADILASEVQESTGYNVYTLLSGLTVESTCC